MNASELCSKIKGEWLTSPFDRPISHFFAGDSVCFALASLHENDIWITTENSMQAVAVASARNITCIILPSGVQMADPVQNEAIRHKISILSSQLSAFEICAKLGAESE